MWRGPARPARRVGRLIAMKDRQRAQVDLARLPDDVADLIAGLAPGGTLVITRGGEPVATVTAAGSAPLAGTVRRRPGTTA
jgi:antitoxin (DNA-binding transcriptional repressor) of toxin-antitoxin stability system